MNSLQTRQLIKVYDRKKRIQYTDMSLLAGLNVLKGPNGIGKSTLLKILAGVDMNWNGSISYAGVDLKKHYKQYTSSVSYSPAELNWFKDITVKDFFDLFTARKQRTDCSKKQLFAAFELDPGAIGELYLRELSFGMLKKVNLISSLMLDCEIYLFDEPINALDKKSTKVFKSEAIRISHKIIVLASHFDLEIDRTNIREFNLSDLVIS